MSIDTPGYNLLKKFRQSDRSNIKIRALNLSVDYAPLVEEQNKAKAKEPDNGVFIPKGNPY